MPKLLVVKKLVRAYFQEAKWYHGKKIPTMEQYMKNGIASSFGYEQWSLPIASNYVLEEQKRGDAPSAIECYMNEYDVTKEEPHMKIRDIIENYWKILNEECLKLTGVMSRNLLMIMINLIRKKRKRAVGVIALPEIKSSQTESGESPLNIHQKRVHEGVKQGERDGPDGFVDVGPLLLGWADGAAGC
ncbi:terpene synthase 17-like [Capsicum annuum]|uniref:terpene synthase 17-like n=1 Tax=Capsicum annuum TaxID=4072 RepID=UPI001FB15E77|nr:terpene synthase 17-like [Capsicum annuum]